MKHLKWSRLVCAIGMAFIVVMSCPQLFAQSTTEGAIGGLVVDPSAGARARRDRDGAQRRHEQHRRGDVTDANGRFSGHSPRPRDIRRGSVPQRVRALQARQHHRGSRAYHESRRQAWRRGHD